MTRTYKAIGINLKSAPIGESDRLLTVLTREFGLIKAVAPGVRKQRSSIGGRSELFVVNELLIAKGRSLDKITQASTVESYPGLSRNLGKLSAAQYLAELAIASALSDEPQESLFFLLGEHLSRLERLSDRTEIESAALLVAHLAQGDPNWQTGFSIPSGGTFSLPELANLEAELSSQTGSLYRSSSRSRQTSDSKHLTNFHINAKELAALQQLGSAELGEGIADRGTWISVENILRQYAQYHLGCTIRSGSSIDTYLESFEF
ncbi:MAG: DNA repair protein RecO [Oscillatoriales cyanobacterium]|nr:MAG: DNA repair protein RecO [Oscillatoriales cyanobacterium]